MALDMTGNREAPHLDAVQTFADCAKGADEAIAWMATLGAAVPIDSRYRRYLSEVQILAERHADPAWRPPDVTRTWSALFEASDLQAIHAGLRGGDIPGLRERLAELVQGPEQMANEEMTAGGIHARNIGFELIMAARLRSAGYEPVLDQRADIIFTVDKQRVVVECKRVRRPETVRARLRHARQQALSDTGGIDAELNSVLLAVEVSVVVNPGNPLLAADKPLPQVLSELSDRIAHSVNVSVRDLWHRRILGVAVRFSGLIVADGLPVYSQEWALIRNSGIDAQRSGALEQLVANLQTNEALRGALPSTK